MAALAVAVLIAGTKPTARAVLKDFQGNRVGTAVFQTSKTGVKVAVKVAGVTPGKLGIQIQAAGRCEPLDLEATIGSLDTSNGSFRIADRPNSSGVELASLTIGEDGSGQLTYVAKGVTLREGTGTLFSSRGAALVLHVGEDQERTSVTGSSGTRIACGIIEKV